MVRTECVGCNVIMSCVILRHSNRWRKVIIFRMNEIFMVIFIQSVRWLTPAMCKGGYFQMHHTCVDTVSYAPSFNQFIPNFVSIHTSHSQLEHSSTQSAHIVSDLKATRTQFGGRVKNGIQNPHSKLSMTIVTRVQTSATLSTAGPHNAQVNIIYY